MVGRNTTLVIVVVLAVASVPVAALGAPTNADVGAQSENPTADSTAGGVQAQQAGDETCNYTQLYNQTIDSVVLIRTGGGLGSGFVYDDFENGTSYVVTNQHVVNQSAEVTVQFARGETQFGRVVGTTAFADLAVVEVNDTPEYVEPLPLADEPPRTGQRVAAIGSPYGLESTMTSGIISGVDRLTRTQAGLIPNTVQTDAPINPGNSGGPLVLCESGAVVGVNRAGGAENIGFAVSASLVRQIVPELVQDGEYDSPYLGIRPAPLTRSIVEANDLDVTQGVYVAEVLSGSPAGEALQGATETEVVADQRVPVGGDVIVGIDGQSVETPEQFLSYLLTEIQPGDEIELTVVRDGERRNVSVTVGERPEPDESA